MKLIEWLKGEGQIQGFLRDLIFVAVVVGAISILSQITLGVWTPMVAVESGSMYPNMKVGDIIVIQGASRTDIITWEEGEIDGYSTFNNPGNVILYRPYGKDKLTLTDQAAHIFLRRPYPPDKATPVIHRAMQWIDEGEPMWEGGPAAPFAGYITKGDNNSEIDQNAGQLLGVVKESYFREQMAKGMIEEVGNGTYLDHEFGYTFIRRGDETYVIFGINYLMPVHEDWVIGVARFRIPIVGYVRLLPNIIGNEIRDLLS
ncbi:MAG TPA: S26 family signal peptidase [Methanothrix sp.]|nr:S26 family signal peptidase [Methanothrix sp.]